jgi:hypothetical protein
MIPTTKRGPVEEHGEQSGLVGQGQPWLTGAGMTATACLLWRFASPNPLYWTTRYQYGAVLMPIAFAAFVDGLVHRPVDPSTAERGGPC